MPTSTSICASVRSTGLDLVAGDACTELDLEALLSGNAEGDRSRSMYRTRPYSRIRRRESSRPRSCTVMISQDTWTNGAGWIGVFWFEFPGLSSIASWLSVCWWCSGSTCWVTSSRSPAPRGSPSWIQSFLGTDNRYTSEEHISDVKRTSNPCRSWHCSPLMMSSQFSCGTMSNDRRTCRLPVSLEIPDLPRKKMREGQDNYLINRGKLADWTTENNFRSQLHRIVVQTFPHFLRGRSGISRLATYVF